MTSVWGQKTRSTNGTSVSEVSFSKTEFAALSYLAAPLVVFILVYLRVECWIAAAFLAFCLWRCAILVNWTVKSEERGLEIYYALLATLVVFASGCLGGIYANSDWIKHFAILRFLVDNNSLVSAPGSHDLGTLRYYLGWYILPALLSKPLSPTLLPVFAGAWSIVGLWLFFANAATLTGRTAWRLALPLVFLLFSGADWIGTAITHYRLGPIGHIEWWAGWIEYSSNYTDIIWAPQHALPAWIGIVIALRGASSSASLMTLPLAIVSIMFWSPFAAVGLAPYFLYVMWQNRRSTTAAAVVSGLLMCIVLMVVHEYLSAGTSSIAMTPVWQTPCLALGPCFSPGSYLLFEFLEVAPTIIICLIATRGRDAFVLIASGLLLVMPLIQFGAANDLNLHGSIPSLALISITAWRQMPSATKWLKLAFAIVMLLGVMTPLGEIRRPFLLPNTRYGSQTFADLYPSIGSSRVQYFIDHKPWIVRAPVSSRSSASGLERISGAAPPRP